MNIPPQKFPVVLIFGRDWASEKGPANWDYPFKPYDCWIAGILIQETDEYLSLAQDYCPETGKVREVFTIAKQTILKRIDYPVE